MGCQRRAGPGTRVLPPRAGEGVSPRYIALLGLKAQASPAVPPPPPPRGFYEGVCRREGD